MFNHPYIPFGSLISAKEIKEFNKRGYIKIFGCVENGDEYNVTCIEELPDEAVFVVCLDDLGNRDIAIEHYMKVLVKWLKIV